jgi:TetR/AcrR family transcriptional regulator, lmrAB and yxaGH operons repressor
MAASVTKSTNKRGATRQRMLLSAAQVMRERGAAGVTIDEVLTRSGAPRGSVYYHFPEGRNQILTEALRFAGDSITATIDGAQGGIPLVRKFVEFWELSLAESDYNAGCPVVAAAIGSADDDPALSIVAGDEADAGSLAVTCIAALEGAVVLCRSTRSADPLRDVAQQLEFLVKSREFVHRYGLPSVEH